MVLRDVHNEGAPAPSVIFSGLPGQLQDEWSEYLSFNGSGGTPMVLFSELSGAIAALNAVAPLVARRPQRESLAGALSVPALLEQIRTAFGLNERELAAACRLRSRKSLYDWKNEITRPRRKNLERLYRLYRAAAGWKRSGFPKAGENLYAPLVQGQSLYDLLTAEVLDLDAIQFTGTRLAFQRETETGAELKDPFV